jgi:DNA-binding protein
LKFFLTEKKVEIEGKPITTYGISIIKKMNDDRNRIHLEQQTVNNICLSLDEIRDFADLLCENVVTPIHLLEVAEDYVAAQEYNSNEKRPKKLQLAS